jgi:excisionase family DNA binding protein
MPDEKKKSRHEMLESGEFIRADQVARKLGVSRRHVFRLLREGKLPGIKLGRVWIISCSSLNKYLKKLVEKSERDLD